MTDPNLLNQHLKKLAVIEAIEDLAHVQDEAILQSLGISVPETASDSESDSDPMCDDPLLGYSESPSTSVKKVSLYQLMNCQRTSLFALGMIILLQVGRRLLPLSSDELRPAFYNLKTGKRKRIECFHVDGAGDEGPSHLEAQLMWTKHYLENGSLATLVSAWCSGCSYLTSVKLQNSCLALAHVNLFIPSTLNGSCMDTTTGEINQEKLKGNLQAATDVYIEHCNRAPCGDTQFYFKVPILPNFRRPVQI